MSHAETLVVVVGEERPAMSVSFGPWSDEDSDGPAGFVVFFSEFDPEVDDAETFPSELVCLHCLVEEGDEQLGRGLDLARVHGRVDWDSEAGEWFVPEPEEVDG